MKKYIIIALTIFSLCLSACSNTQQNTDTAQTNHASIEETDYSSYIGKWNWENSVPLKENQENYYDYDEAWIDIKDIKDNMVTFEYYHQKGGVHLYFYDVCSGTIEDNFVTASTDARKSPDSPASDNFKITLELKDDMIYLEAYNNTYGKIAFSGNFQK